MIYWSNARFKDHENLGNFCQNRSPGIARKFRHPFYFTLRRSLSYKFASKWVRQSSWQKIRCSMLNLGFSELLEFCIGYPRPLFSFIFDLFKQWYNFIPINCEKRSIQVVSDAEIRTRDLSIINRLPKLFVILSSPFNLEMWGINFDDFRENFFSPEIFLIESYFSSRPVGCDLAPIEMSLNNKLNINLYSIIVAYSSQRFG